MSSEKQYVASAFVSCSLRAEDQPFVEYVCQILDAHNIRPFGTVGKFSASPENPVELMRKNIPASDFVVICATPRYLSRDLSTGIISYGLPEMVHVESGMALAYNKPVVVFVQEGTNVGSFLPNITQYITLTGDLEDYKKKQKLIYSLLSESYAFVQKLKENKSIKQVGNVAIVGLAIYGAYKLIEEFIKQRRKK
ncbi:MAG: toll/interleukin-1 receptor domain-containing protein [Chitinophagaceae bacterium]|jgi:hypothetical protein|nr:toll/interleukin-1 receptor domain-containing protein [Chitinophagaceae bacterium]